MAMNFWLIFIVTVILAQYFLECGVSLANLRALSPHLPREFAQDMASAEYAKSQEYTKATTKFSLIEETWMTSLVLIFFFTGGFNLVDLWARHFGFGSLATGCIYILFLLLLSFLASLPFSIYSTFVIEERFGFNKTTVRTFIFDLLKSGLLAFLIGTPVLSLILWLLEHSGPFAWIYCWTGVVIVSFLLTYLAPVFIMPLFNTFTPLPDGPLKHSIETYAKQEYFQLNGIFTMDGSKRSTKLNAFFTGFGRFRKIVFFDTLLEKLAEKEIIAVLAHEMGHYKRHHVEKRLLASILHTGALFYFFSLMINNGRIFSAFQMANISIYASLIFFVFLFSPINFIISVIFNMFSRTHEYEADIFAAKTTGTADHLISGLKKLVRENLSNLTPHPLYVFFHHSHPPVLMRILALQRIDHSIKTSSAL